MTLEELKVVITAQTSGLKKELDGVKKQLGSVNNETSKATSGMMASFKKLIVGVIALKIGQKIGQAITSGLKEAMNIEAAIQQIKRIMGESSNQFLKWAQTQALAFNMSQGQAIKYGSVFGNLVSSFSSSTAEITKNTEDVLKASSIIASATVRTMDDVMERIRSGLLGNTESIEDLGVNVNVAMIQSTEAFKKFANGRQWQQLDFQTQQQIRLMAILEQTTKKYGDAVNQNTSSQLQQLVAVLGNVRLALGQAFLPIAQIIIPMLTQLAQGLYTIISVVSQFSQALFGKPAQQQAQQAKATVQQAKAVTGLGNAYKDAGKKAKGALASFDEISSLSKNGSGGGDAGGGMDIPSGGMSIPAMTNVADMTSNISPQIQMLANRIKNIVFSTIDLISSKLKRLWESVIEPIADYILNDLIIPICDALKENLLPVIYELGSGAIKVLFDILDLIIATIDNIRGIVQPALDLIKTIVIDLLEIIKSLWDKYGQDLIKNISNFIKGVQSTLQLLWDKVLNPIIKPFLEMLSWLWDKHLKGLVEQVGEFVMKVVNGVLEIYNIALKPFIDWIISFFGPMIAWVVNFVVDIFGSMLAGIADVVKGLFKVLGGVVDFITGIFTGNWKKAWEGVKDIFKGVFDSLVGIVKIPLNYIIDAINAVIRGLNKIKIDLPDWGVLPDNLEGKSFGVHIPQIPKLAQGGYVGANNPLMAIVGDNRSEGEIIAPESKIYEQTFRAVKDALNSGNESKNIIIMLNETELGRASINAINRAQRVAGTTLLNV